MPKVYTGPKGGKYYYKNNKKVYVTSKTSKTSKRRRSKRRSNSKKRRSRKRSRQSGSGIWDSVKGAFSGYKKNVYCKIPGNQYKLECWSKNNNQ